VEDLRKQADEDEHKALFEHLPQKIFYKNRNLRYVSCNSNYARDLNIAPDEIVGKTDYDFYPKKLAEKYRVDDRSVIESGKSKEMEEEYIQDGREVFVHTIKTPVKDKNGNIGVLGIFWDITEHKQVEKSLEAAIVKAEEEKNKVDAIIAALGDGIIIQDTDYKVIYQNNLQNNAYGNHVGEYCYKAYEGRDVICEDCPIELSFKDGKIHKTIRRTSTDKGALYVELTSSPLMDSAGNIIAGVKIVRDITEQKRAEEALFESEERLRRIIEQSGDGIVLVNEQGIIVEWNESEAQITGLKRSDAVGIPIWEAQLRVAPEEKRDPRRLEQMRDSTLEVIRTGQAPWLNKLTEDEIQRPDGTRRIIQSSVFLTKTSKGVMIGSVSRDITEQKQVKEKLQRAKNLSDTLNRINIEINLTIDLDEILQHVVDRCVEAVGAETGVILLKESHQWAVKYLNRRLREQRPEFLNLQFEENQLNAAMRAINTGKPIAVDDAYNDETSNQEMVRKYSIRSYLVTPLISRGTVAGVLMIIYNSAPTTFDNDTVDFASKVATSVSLALENARLFEEQKQVEEELRKARDELEARVQERTTDLIKANRALEIEVSERRQIENALRKSEERFKQVAQSSGAWIWEVDTEGLYTYSNSTVEKILGYSPEEIVGKSHFYDFFVPELRESLKKAALDMFGKKESFKAFLNSNVDKKGNIVFLETSGLPILDEQGNLLGYRGADVDVTEQKLDEEELREREHSYRTLAENLPGIVYRVFLRENDRMQFFNDMVQSMTGYTAEELTTGDVCAIDPLILAVDRDRVTSVVKRAVVNNQPFQLEYRIMRKDGDIRQFYERGRPVYGADGKPIYVDGVIFDISERKKADERLLEQAELLDKARDAIVVRDVKNSIIYWNMGAERLYGWKAEEVLGKNSNQLFYSEMPAILAEAQQAVIGKGEWVGELTQVTKDGREVVVQARWTLVRDDDGKPKSILVINTDVTEKKNLEAQLLRAQRLEVVGALAGGVAHDINNVLTPIMLSLYILKGKLKDEDGENLIEILETSAKRGASLIKQIQTFARGAEGERKPIKITDVISEVEKMIKETFPRNIEVRTYLDSNLQTISGNATEIHQVIMNLCVNARDAMPNGGTLGISAENITMNEKDTHMSIEAKVGTYVGITVTDTGTGISKKIIDKIFDPFFTTKEFGKGTGLGLSTALAIVKGHGGFMNVYSEVGKGSTFKIYLPATTSAETEMVEERIKPPAGHGETILIAEDEKSIREITAAMLEASGYKTITAKNGMETIAMYMQNMSRVKVILIDMMMPIMDGQATIRTLRKINPKVKILAVSGYAKEERYEKSIKDVQAFLMKPYTIEELMATIRKVLQHNN